MEEERDKKDKRCTENKYQNNRCKSFLIDNNKYKWIKDSNRTNLEMGIIDKVYEGNFSTKVPLRGKFKVLEAQ